MLRERKAPKFPSKQYKEILAAGCGGYQDYYGDWDCGHDYPWECDRCPIVEEKFRLEMKREEAEAKIQRKEFLFLKMVDTTIVETLPVRSLIMKGD